MNGMDLLLALGGINGKYIDDAENGPRSAPVRKRSKFLLIAAIIALTLALVGCAAAILLNLDALRIGERPYLEPARYNEEGEKTPASEGVADIISLQGIEGSANYQAVQEWLQFRQDYDPEHKLWTGEFQAPPEYVGYGAYTQEMLDKLTEILQKYDLNPHGRSVTDQYADWEMVQTALGIDGFLKDGAMAEERYNGGHLWECGNFNLYFYLTLTDPESALEDALFVNYLYCGKAYFHDWTATVHSEKAQQWNLTLEDGTDLLIVTDEEQAHILCDRTDAFISIYLPMVWDRLDGTEGTISREDIERVAKAIDFSIQTRPVEDMDWVETKVEENVAAVENFTEDPEVLAERKRIYEENEFKDSYAELIAQIRDNEEYFATRCNIAYKDAWNTMSYALMDVTGDGEEELLLGRDDHINEIWTMQDGKTDRLTAGSYSTGDLCEGYVFRDHIFLDGAHYYYFFDLTDNGGTPIEYIYYERYGDCWYHEDYRAQREAMKTSGNSGTTTTTTTTTGGDPRVAITEEEANRIVQSYTIIPVEMTPVKEFPMP